MGNKGVFITLEGIEGAGKTTLVPFIVELLQDHGHDVIKTREPGSTRLGEKIREILLTKDDVKINDDTELLLMFAARAQHVKEVIQPALDSGKTIICDRFTDSSYAYQSGGRGIEEKKIDYLVKVVHADLKPDLTLLFDLPVKLGMDRANKRDLPDRFESETIDFFQSVRDKYIALAKAEPDRIKIINAEADLGAVKASLTEVMKKAGIC